MMTRPSCWICGVPALVGGPLLRVIRNIGYECERCTSGFDDTLPKPNPESLAEWKAARALQRAQGQPDADGAR